MRRPALAMLLLAASCASAPVVEQPLQLSSRAKEREELIAKLKRDLVKVERAIGVTERLIEQSRSAPYLPDLMFRHAELYVEKSRYRFRLEAEQNAAVGQGSLVVPDVTLLKQKAVSIYEKVVREYPDFKENDKVRFFIAHEMRELGDYEKALKAYQDLVDKHPKSPLVSESLLVIADYWFDKSDLDKAETFYLKILDTPPTPAHDLARYKLGWVWINRSKHAEAVKYFEAAARSPVREDDAKSLSIKGLALSDLVYSYTEARPAKGAIEFFEALCDQANTFEIVLEKLGNRYFIKQEFENAAPAYRKLLTISRDFERDPDRAARLYDTVKASKGKVAPRFDDVEALVRVAARARTDMTMEEKDRKALLADIEVYARDLATMMQVEAQKKDDKRLHSEAADAYQAYLDLFRSDKWRLPMMKNRAEALFAAGRFAEAGRQYEEVAKIVQGPAREEPLYRALVSFQSALKTPEKLTHFERTDSRAGIRQLGSFYVKAFPQNQNAAKVKFNIARAHYEDGMLKEAAELFTSFAIEYPNDPDASISAHLALDSLHALKDFKGLGATASKLLSARLPASLQAEIRAIAGDSKNEELAEAMIASDTGEAGEEGAIQRLLKIAEDPTRANTDVAEKALNNALAHAAARRDLKAVAEVAAKIQQMKPNSAAHANAVLTQARLATEMADFDQAAVYLESMHAQFGSDSKALEALDNAASLRLMLGETSRAIGDFEKLAQASPRSDALPKLAEAKLAARDFSGAERTAEQALRAQPGSARAAAVLGEALLEQGKISEVEQRLAAAGRGLQNAAQSDPLALAKVYFLWGEALYKQFESLPKDDLEKRAGMLQNLQQAYISAAQLGGEWAVAGMYRLGQALSSLAVSLQTMPEPPGLSDAERGAFRAALNKQAGELKFNSEEAFSSCLKKARELEVYSPFALGCATRREVDGRPPAPPPAQPAADSSRIQELRAALGRNPSDGNALEELGQLYLKGGDLRRARLVLSRLVEVDDARASGHGALGFVLAQLGETDAARVSLKKALELDGRDPKARANLAALKCRYGDAEGARDDVKKLKGNVAGSDVDPGWAGCRK